MFHYAVSILLGLLEILTLAASSNEKTRFILLLTAQFVVKPCACKCLIAMSRMVANNLCSSYDKKNP